MGLLQEEIYIRVGSGIPSLIGEVLIWLQKQTHLIWRRKSSLMRFPKS